ncbi:hypothetical protein AMELA_G00131360 [Ameiurus melas]|uniref:UDENN domain-containing protein n=1 Tax=Ameiurus melas TaxID=219545 RepID=A0A7J6AJ97_AMEME|nr:hypothetical protein AMELA_G00131360 [Ameiurus melas]
MWAPRVSGVREDMTANKNSKATPKAGGAKTPQELPDRCRSASPPPILSAVKEPCHTEFSETEDARQQSRYAKADTKVQCRRNPSRKAAILCRGSALSTESQSRLTKAKSIGCLDKKLSIYKPSGEEDQEQKENQLKDGPSGGDTVCPGPLSWSTLSLASSSSTYGHKRTLSLSRNGTGPSAATIRKKISEWECRNVALPRMSLCLDKRAGGGSEGCPSLLSSPCSEKAFDFKSMRRMSTAYSECSYPETEEEDGTSDRECSGRVQKREGQKTFVRTLYPRKEASAVLNRIQKIEQALKESPSAPPKYLSNCYGLDKSRQKSFTISPRHEDLDSTCDSKRSSICSVATEPDAYPGSEKLSKFRQRFSVASFMSESPEPSCAPGPPAAPATPGPPAAPATPGPPVNPLPKPKRTFEYDANRSHRDSSPSNGIPPNPDTRVPPDTVKTPVSSFRRTPDRESCESEDAVSLPSSYPSSPTENGTVSTENHSRPSSKGTLEENAYEDITESMRENPYEDVDLKERALARKSRLLPERSNESLNRTWTSQDRKSSTPPQLPSKPSSQSLRLLGQADRKSHRFSRLSKRHSHDDMLLLPQLSSPSCGLLDDGLSSTSDTLASHRRRRVPKVVRRINSIFSTKRGKKRLKKLLLSNIETASLRDDNSESESDSDDRAPKLQSYSAPIRTLELQLIEWQERELFEYFVVVSLKKKPSKNSYMPEVSYQFPKLERLTKQMREAEQRLKAIPQFCFPDAKDWSPVSDYSSETFSFMLTGEDGSRRFGYCRRLLPSGKGQRLPEVYCVISRLGCFDLFSKVMELRRPMDSRLEHVDFESLFSCLSVRQVVCVFASLLLERRVIFVADKLSVLSSCVHAVVALLYPFSWQHTFIPVLPSSMVDIVCCPTPFLVGILSSSLPKLKELPVEEALMVHLGTDRFIRQLDDEASLLPRKLQAALEQVLEQRNHIIDQDSDSESDDECNSLNSVVSEAFIRFFLETIGHYSLFLTQGERGERVFQREAFRKSVASKSIRRFLGVFMESQMFAGFIQDRELRKSRAKGLFEQRAEQYLEELPDTEQSGVNKFLKGLGNKMKFLHKKN